MSQRNVIVTGLGGASALGNGVAAQVAAMNERRCPLRPLGGHPEAGGVSPELLAGWIDDRSWLSGRKYGGASNASVRAARMAVEDAAWTSRDLVNCHVFSGSSRGNTGELFGAWQARGPVHRLATSNSMHSETASAVTVELGICGPWTTLSNGCSSGQDALALAFLTLSSGLADRALVIGVEFPLIPELLSLYQATGILSTNNVNDPYSPATSGMLPGEAVGALALEVSDRPGPRILAALANSDAYDTIRLPADSAPTIRLLEAALKHPEIKNHKVSAICPHASGTLAHGMAEQNALATVFRGVSKTPVSLHFMKPFTGHSLGACGAIDAVLLCAFLRHQQLPPNLPGMTTAASGRFTAPETSIPFDPASCLLKISAGMGGRNSIIVFKP
jgi:3-oxoacyl-[acyl-carrier-protein] synthase II